MKSILYQSSIYTCHFAFINAYRKLNGIFSAYMVTKQQPNKLWQLMCSFGHSFRIRVQRLKNASISRCRFAKCIVQGTTFCALPSLVHSKVIHWFSAVYVLVLKLGRFQVLAEVAGQCKYKHPLQCIVSLFSDLVYTAIRRIAERSRTCIAGNHSWWWGYVGRREKIDACWYPQAGLRSGFEFRERQDCP